MTRFTDRVERDLGQIADRATPSSTAWEAIQQRIAEQDFTEPTMEVVMLAPDPDKNRTRTRGWILAAAAAVLGLALVAGLIATSGDDSEPVITDQPEPTAVVEPEPGSAAPQIPAEGSVVEPGSYETDLLGMGYRIAVPETTRVWTARPNVVLLSDADPSADSPYAGDARTVAVMRISGWNTPVEAVDGEYVGPGSLDPEDIDGWAATHDLDASITACCKTVDTGEGSERVRTVVGGRTALPLDVSLDPAATSQTFPCGDGESCLWAASVSGRGGAPRLGVDPLVSSDRVHRFWILQIDGSDPFLVHSSAPEGDEAWLRLVDDAELDQVLFPDVPVNGPFSGPDAPPMTGG